MAAAAVRFEGLRELQRAFSRMGGDLRDETRTALKDAAEPVRKDAEAFFSRVDARSAAGYRAYVRARGVAVGQSRKGRKWKRPNYVRMQYGIALNPALESNTNEIVEGLERMIDRLGGRNGF
jgi:hypothetical protein